MVLKVEVLEMSDAVLKVVSITFQKRFSKIYSSSPLFVVFIGGQVMELVEVLSYVFLSIFASVSLGIGLLCLDKYSQIEKSEFFSSTPAE